jgi:hypothetical protein
MRELLDRVALSQHQIWLEVYEVTPMRSSAACSYTAKRSLPVSSSSRAVLARASHRAQCVRCHRPPRAASHRTVEGWILSLLPGIRPSDCSVDERSQTITG